MLNVAAHKDMG